MRNTPTHVGKTLQKCRFSIKRWKHPHARGEDRPAKKASTPRSETPPRTWGRLFDRKDVLGLDGNTPTHVGKTKISFFRSVIAEKHPHARGEDSLLRCPCQRPLETPPRTWGRLHFPCHLGDAFRNTPTHVGKTLLHFPCHLSNRKHPHARGEDFSSPTTRRTILETPPRTWGRLCQACSSLLAQRNTPTHVGKTHLGARTLRSI